MMRGQSSSSNRHRQALACVVTLSLQAWLLASALAASAYDDPDYVFPTPTADELQLIKGALDIHVHLDPDSAGEHSTQSPRQLDVIDMAIRAREVGMRGFVIKQHYDQSAQLAYVTRRAVPGVEVYGGVGQNLAIGGVNVEAVYHMAEVKGGWGRIVWMPTWDAEHNIAHQVAHRGGKARPHVPVVADGEVTERVRQVLAAIATTVTRDSGGQLLLETGHLSPEEALLVVRAAGEAGVKNIVVTHAFGSPVFMSIEQMKQAVEMGAMIEFVASYAMGSSPLFPADVYADAIRQVGIENVIISSDFGQEGRPSPPDALAVFAGMMLKQGFTAADLHRMLAINPAKALGLPPE